MSLRVVLVGLITLLSALPALAARFQLPLPSVLRLRRFYAVALLATAAAGLNLVSADAVQRDPVGRDSLLGDAGLLETTIFDPPSGCLECSILDAAPFQTKRLAPSFAIDSRAALVFDDTCEEVLYGKNEHARLPPASLTKMMTALVAVEQVADLDRRVNVDLSAAELVERTRSSVMGLEPGMQVTLRDLLYGLLLPSGNDAALVLAENTAGSVDAFVDLMNDRAAALGLTDTRFANPHGLDNRGLYSTAYDLVALARAMMANPIAAEIASAPRYAVAGPGFHMVNSNRLIGSYEGAYGVKIGYTRRAAHTIVAAAERDGRSIYVSVLGSKVSYVDVTQLLDWAFQETTRSC